MVYIIGKVVSKLLSYMGKESASYILSYDINAEDCASEDGEFRLLRDPKAVDQTIGGLRIESRKFLDWIDAGGLVCVAEVDSVRGMPRGWLHVNGTREVSSFMCELGSKSAWLGPDFVPAEYRGKKYQYRLIINRIYQAKRSGGIDFLFTGINVSNVPSIKNYLESGFRIVALLRSRRILFFSRRKLLVYSDIVEGNLKIV